MPDSVFYRGVKIEAHRQRWRWRLQSAGKRVVRSAATREEAKALLDRYLGERAPIDEASIARQRRQTVADVCEEWFAYKRGRLAPGTEAQYEMHIRVHIIPGLGSADATTICLATITDFYSTLRWKAAKESHNVLRQAFGWALANDRLHRVQNPFLIARPSRRTCIDGDDSFPSNDLLTPLDEKRIPTREEVDKLLRDAQARDDQTWWLYLRIATATGARPGEVCALRRSDIDVGKEAVHIGWTADKVGGRLKRPKTASGVRTLHLSSDFFAEIEPLLPSDPEAFLFPSNTYRGAVSPLPCWNARGVKRRLDAALERAGLRHITPHAFRHYVATHLLANGESPTQVARFLGHKDDQLVRRLYGNHFVDPELRRVGEAASRLV